MVCLEVGSLMRGYEIPQKELIALRQQQMHTYSYIAIFTTSVGGNALQVTRVTQ